MLISHRDEHNKRQNQNLISFKKLKLFVLKIVYSESYQIWTLLIQTPGKSKQGLTKNDLKN